MKFFLSIVIVFTQLTFFTGIVNAGASSTDLVGVLKPTQLKEKPYKHWFDEGYEVYSVNEETASKLADAIQGHSIKIFMGTWCHDSQREAPRLFKLMDVIGYGADNVEVIGLDRNKQTPDGRAKKAGIQRTPTIVVYKGAQEVGRIIETPDVSLEDDLLSLLTR